MSARATAVSFPYVDIDDDYGAYDAFTELRSGEPVSKPLQRRSNPVRRVYITLILLIAAAWAFAHRQSDWARFASASILSLADGIAAARQGVPDAIFKKIEDGAGAPSAPADVANGALTPQPETKEVAAPALPDAAIELPPVTSVAEPEADAEANAGRKQQTTPLKAPAADPSDPYQKRAAAAGLHPKLSRVLLAKLSPADYRNAKTAIEQAVAKTPDTGSFVWPMKRKPELALFEVHFVAGAAPDCRRYVVTIAKDGWMTTALPMEKCGASQIRHGA